MIILSWNCQGLGSDLTFRTLKDLSQRHKTNVVFLMEENIHNKEGDEVSVCRIC